MVTRRITQLTALPPGLTVDRPRGGGAYYSSIPVVALAAVDVYEDDEFNCSGVVYVCAPPGQCLVFEGSPWLTDGLELDDDLTMLSMTR